MNPPRKSARGRASGLRLFFRLIGWSFSAAIALVVLLYLALPAMLRYGVPQVLARYGVASSVEGARVDLANEKVTLVGFQVGGGGVPEIRWGELAAHVDFAELLKGNIRIIDFQVKDARVDLGQLAASDWKPPEQIAAIPRPGRLKIDIGDLVLQNLKFLGLSERIGKPVEIRSMSLGSLSHLQAGDQVAFNVEVVIGEASLKAAGRARMVDNLPVLEGRYELGALGLDGFGRVLGLQTPGALGGRLRGDGTFRLAYLQGQGVVESVFSGRAEVVRLQMRSGSVAVKDASGDWSGDLTLWWPVAGTPPGMEARGIVSAARFDVEQALGGQPVSVSASGFKWRGEASSGASRMIDGRFEAERLRVSSTPDGGARWQLELSGVGGEAAHRSDAAASGLAVKQAGAEQVRFTQSLNAVTRAATIYKLAVEDVHSGVGGYMVERLAFESAESPEAQNVAGIHRLIGFEAKAVEVATTGSVRAASMAAEQLKFDSGSGMVVLSGARADGVRAGPAVPFGAEVLSVDSASHQRGERETWTTALKLFGARLTADGAMMANEASAERVNQLSAGEPAWEAGGVSAAGLSASGQRVDAERLELGALVIGRARDDLLELQQARLSTVSFQNGDAGEAQRLEFETLRYRGGQIAALEIRDAEVAALAISAAGTVRARSVEAGRLRHTDSNANVTDIDEIHIGEGSGALSGNIRIDAARAGRLDHRRAAGTTLKAQALNLSGIDFSAAGTTAAVAAHADQLDASFPGGTRLRLEEPEVAGPSWKSAGGMRARSGRTRSLALEGPDGARLAIYELEMGAVEGDADGGHRVASIRARAGEASAAAQAGSLETGQLALDAVGLTAAGAATVERLAIENLRVANEAADPLSSLAISRLELLGPRAGPRGSIRLGRVSLSGADVTAGLDAQGEFVLPWSGGRIGVNMPQPDGISFERAVLTSPSRLEFIDRSTTPPFEIGLEPLELELENEDSTSLESPARFSFEGRLSEFSSMGASGSFALSPRGLDFEVSGTISGFDLVRLNTYAVRHSGRAIRSGRGDAKFDITIRRRELSGTVRFVFRQVTFEAGDAPAGDSTGSGGRLTLPEAVAMLKDSHGVVRLTVPVSGSFDDPRFDFSDVLAQGIVRSVRSAVMLTFKPLGLLVTATGLLVNSGELEFKPVAFDAGEKSLNSRDLTYLDRLSEQLESHPGVDVHLCGRAVPADRISIEQRRNESAAEPADNAPAGVSAEIDASLEALAEERAAAVRRYLQRQRGIAGARLHACTPEVETTPGRLPRVDIPVRVDFSGRRAASEQPG